MMSEAKKLYHKAYREAHKEKHQAYMFKYYRLHAEKLKTRERARHHENKEKANARRRKWSNDHLDYVQEKARKYHWDNRAKRLAYMSKYNVADPIRKKSSLERLSNWIRANKNLAREAVKRWSKKNSNKIRLDAKLWREKNPGKVTARDARRRALELGAKTDIALVDQFFDWIRNQDQVTCTYCGKLISGKQIEVDHIVPISRGGDHLPDNFCVSCRSCNASKRDKFLHEWKECPEKFKQPFILATN